MKIFVEDPSEYDHKGMLWSGAEKALEEIIDAEQKGLLKMKKSQKI